jgi:hypothetical protein
MFLKRKRECRPDHERISIFTGKNYAWHRELDRRLFNRNNQTLTLINTDKGTDLHGKKTECGWLPGTLRSLWRSFGDPKKDSSTETTKTLALIHTDKGTDLHGNPDSAPYSRSFAAPGALLRCISDFSFEFRRS